MSTGGLRPLSKTSPECHHNFIGTSRERWGYISKAKGPDCKPGSEILDQIFPLKHYLMHEVTIGGQTGPAKRVVQTILMDVSGNAYKFTSKGVEESLRLMVSEIAPDEWQEPIPIVVRSTTGSGGRRYYTITPADERYVEEE